MKKTFFKGAGTTNTYFSIIISLSIPAFVICLALIFITFLNFNSTKYTVQNTVNSTLSRLSRLSESKILSIIETTSLIENIPGLRNNLEKTDAVADDSLIQQLKMLKNTNDFIDDVYIINKNSATVCSSNSIYDAKDFFEERYIYEDYSYSYWNNFRFYRATDYRILSPSIVHKGDHSDVILPIIFRNTQNLYMQNFLVYNIKLSYLMDFNKDENIFNSSIYILNKYTNDIFSPDSINPIEFPEAFSKELLIGTNKSFKYKLNGKNVLVNMYSPNNTLVGYTYFSITPESVITYQLLPNIMLTLIIFIFFLLFSGFAVRRGALSLYNPLKNIRELLSNNDYSEELSSNKGDIFRDITNYALKLNETNLHLSTILPCAQEQYLISYLNSTTHYVDDKKQEIIKNSLPFSHDFFAVVIVHLSPTRMLFDFYSNTDYENIQRGFYALIKDMFAAEFQSFVLPGDNENLYIVLNFDNEDNLDKIYNIFETIYELLQCDLEYINLSVGKSSCYKGLDGLKKAHLEAINSLTPHFSISHRINIEKQSIIEFNFDSKTESDLYIELISGNRKNVYALLDRTLKQNTNITSRAYQQLYTCIVNIALKVIRIKKLSYNDTRLDFEILSDLLNQSPHKIHKTTMELIDFVLSATENYSSQSSIDTSAVIAYIEKNFTLPDLSLDHLANHFHISPSNISVLIKGNLNIGFHEYITMLRINRAKVLLLETNKNIESISSECGFNSTQTFYRTFRKITGQTPTAFRKNPL